MEEIGSIIDLKKILKWTSEIGISCVSIHNLNFKEK